ncbi:PHD finger protein 20-like protein 1 [Papilio machaon]|uniref:PHD finger protein 20-like protein 1 n=1 Tax=Papilio machaon TaxID=76193 RepID=A0A194RP32_PAPMA|nr:PHD finger protein 20-like protein 1 [Papilio machaon]
MAVKKCCIENCPSCSTRKEDIGVTYHKYPKDERLCDTWITITRNKQFDIATTSYVCSRHFRKRDFQIYKDCKYVLKSDAIPSIFPWDKTTSNMNSNETTSEADNAESASSRQNDFEMENLDAIKKFIEDQAKEIEVQKCDEIAAATDKKKDIEDRERLKDELTESEMQEEPLTVATSVMDLILSQSEARMLIKKEDKGFDKQCVGPEDKGNVTLSVGSKVEAKDFEEFWHQAEIIEVDYDEMEVLVHYENDSKKHDEWISVSSPRLRPVNNTPTTTPTISSSETTNVEVPIIKEEVKEEKAKLKYVVGERCLARWRDNRRFIATVNKDLGNGSYEIVFDDGFHWKCTTSRMFKLKDTDRIDPLNVDTSSSSSTSPSPISFGPGPSTANTGSLQTPVFHTHLFDPTRDYLGSKSERREKKRKLNIKEIFNIGQKKRKKQKSPKEPNSKAPRVIKQEKPEPVRKKIKLENDVGMKNDIPDALASIIGTVAKPEVDIKHKTEVESPKVELDNKEDDSINIPQNVENVQHTNISDVKEGIEVAETRNSLDPVLEEETKLENFEVGDDKTHEEVIDRIKEAIIKLEDGMNKTEKVDSPKEEIPEEEDEDEIKDEIEAIPVELTEEKLPLPEQSAMTDNESKGQTKKSVSHLKRNKKLRLLQAKAKKKMEKVECELAEMKRQVEEMRKQIVRKQEMPESFLLPGEWCCRWVNGQPVGSVSEIESEIKVDPNSKPPLPRRSVQVEDKRLPAGWTKHMVRRSFGNSAGKWDVVLVSPENRRFHTKTDMRMYIEKEATVDLRPYEHALLDFGIHLKLARRMGWVIHTGTEEPVTPLPAGMISSTSPLVKRKKLSLNRVKGIVKSKEKKRKWNGDTKIRRMHKHANAGLPGTSNDIFDSTSNVETPNENATLEDGYVFVGSLKVQVIENLLRCPADGCFKNFRNNTLLKMHIKHYHRELRKLLGSTPKVLDLAYARTRPTKLQMTKLKKKRENKVIKVKIPKPMKRTEDKIDINELNAELQVDIPISSPPDLGTLPKEQDSPKLRNALANKPVKRPKVLLPVRRLDSDTNENFGELGLEARGSTPVSIPEVFDFERGISTHTVTKPIPDLKKKDKKRREFATFPNNQSEDDDWFSMNSDVETRSSFPGSGTPDSKTMENKTSVNAAPSSESNEDQKETMYTYTETGERVKIVQMKREEIINCHCGYREEDGLMVQCELCLCWQHALCHNIQRESEVPEKYTCSICLNPKRGRRSKRFVHDQDRMYEGVLAGGAKPAEPLRRAHELAGNLLRVQDALHALRVKYYVATKKDHPKLYLWAKDWENTELTMTQEKLNSDYSDLNIMIHNIGKENLPLKTDDVRDIAMDVTSEEGERFTQRDIPLGPQTLLSGLLSSPGGTSLELPISTSELERLAKCVQEQGPAVRVPQPEAAIENSACRERLLRHIQRCQALLDSRLDSIEAQVAELESQDPLFEDDETAEFFPRTKQTIQMLLRDLDTMEELGVIT